MTPGDISAGGDSKRAGAFGRVVRALRSIGSVLSTTIQSAIPRRNIAAGGSFEYGNSKRSVEPKISAFALPGDAGGTTAGAAIASMISDDAGRKPGGSGSPLAAD